MKGVFAAVLTPMRDDLSVEAELVDQFQQLLTPATGYVFNLGHGVLPETDPDALTRVVELVVEGESYRRRQKPVVGRAS